MSYDGFAKSEKTTGYIIFSTFLKGVEIDHLFYNKISDLTLKPLFSGNVLILIKIVTKIRPRFQHPFLVSVIKIPVHMTSLKPFRYSSL
jgi:hypothetical protein